MNKILFTSSSGGHLEELFQLDEFINEQSILVTEGKPTVDNRFRKKYFVRQINRREKHFLFHFIQLSIRELHILRIEKPDIIISTGALTTVPICIFAKLMKKKVIYIESFARITTPSLTGKILYHFADLFIVQWKELLKVYPKAKYFGGIF
ncbi:PssD/Cps14F family polysaccharide biosynthesis glycosyltransferase [Limosilactobacillus reuteri]|uniref:PssD/Cps14F family polysaccharide biosynthesis glycosyltransferase n=1 Tax=Limosilactobacillus reuteri TaxID=1598 RepID=UPI003F684E8C